MEEKNGFSPQKVYFHAPGMQRQANVKIEEIVIKSSNNQWPSDDCTMSELTRQSQNQGADMLHLPIVKGSPCTLSHHPNNRDRV